MQKLTLHTKVAYADVDRSEVILLSRIFKLLQEAAIAQANEFGTGTHALAARGETWMLNRMAVEIARYPRANEELRVETWATAIKGFKGWRDFRIFDAQGNAVVSASSLWLYVSLKTKAIVRVPVEIVDAFPISDEPPRFPGLEKMAFEAPSIEASSTSFTLRYSDFDVNEHVNNAAYLDLLQAALARAGLDVHPRRVQLKFAQAIPRGTDAVAVRIERREAAALFSVEDGAQVCAIGEVAPMR